MVKLNKIYTRTGDDGTTGLVDGSRVSKTDARMVAIGEVDEANSALGVAIQALEADEGDTQLVAGLRRIQNELFDLGADIATPGESFEPSPMELRIVAAQVDWLEAAIDAANDELAAADQLHPARRQRCGSGICIWRGRYRAAPSARWLPQRKRSASTRRR